MHGHFLWAGQVQVQPTALQLLLALVQEILRLHLQQQVAGQVHRGHFLLHFLRLQQPVLPFVREKQARRFLLQQFARQVALQIPVLQMQELGRMYYWNWENCMDNTGNIIQ